MTTPVPRQRIAPVTGNDERFRSLQPIVEAELAWGNHLTTAWYYDVHNDEWNAELRRPLHLDLIRERFDLGDGVELVHERGGWAVMDVVGRVYLHSHDVGVVLSPNGRTIDNGRVARALSWLDRKVSGRAP